jgi:hypothetical protein
MMKISIKQRLIFGMLTLTAILAADLTITLINKYIMTFKNRVDLHIMTLIGMGIVFVMFYILVSNIVRLSDWTVRTFVKLGRVYLGRSIGLYITVAVLFVFIYAGYYWAWFDRNLFDEIVKYLKSLLVKL